MSIFENIISTLCPKTNNDIYIEKPLSDDTQVYPGQWRTETRPEQSVILHNNHRQRFW